MKEKIVNFMKNILGKIDSALILISSFDNKSFTILAFPFSIAICRAVL